MKRMLSAMLMLAWVFFLAAGYIRDEPVAYTQPDGTRLSLFVTGDEFYHRVHDDSGHTVLLHPESGYAVYAIEEGNGIKPSEYVVGQVDPSDLNIVPDLAIESSMIRERIRLRQERAGNMSGRAPTTGTINNILIFVRFDDQTEYTIPIFTYENMCNFTIAPSLKGYFQDESAGQLSINTSFHPSAQNGFVRSYQDNHDRGYFSPHSAANPIGYTSEDQGFTRLQMMMISAVAQVMPSIPPQLVIDSDNDGNADNITFVVKGDPDAMGDVLWPQWWTLNLVPEFYIYGKRVWDYNLHFSNTITVGGLCHEMSHTLGFPDLFHHSVDGMDPVGPWDLMSSDTDNPPHHLAYMKWKYGQWFDAIPELTPTPEASTYTLASIASSPFACYKIPSNLENQYYVLEYRRPAGIYENSLPGSGLIVTRVMEGVDGNAAGPPDEVYIYRPDGTLSMNGNIESANFSSSVGRTELNTTTNPAPWLWLNASTAADGNLQLSAIGENTGSSISFTIQNASANVWDGSAGTDWHSAANWSLNLVPVVGQDVQIPAGLSNYPVISEATGTRHLTVATGATLTIGTGTLTLTGNLENHGILAMNHASGTIYGNNLYFHDNSSAEITADAEISLSGNVEFHEGSDVDLTHGCLKFIGSGISNLRVYTPSAVNHLALNKAASYYTSFSSLSTAPLTINGHLKVYAGNEFHHTNSHDLILMGNLNVYDSGRVTLYYGTVVLQGDQNSILNFEEEGSYLNNLRINKSGTYKAELISDHLLVDGHLTIQSGRFDASSHTLKLVGNWTNNVGPAAFLEGTSTVILNGTSNQPISSEDFHVLVLDKPGGEMLINSGSAVSCDLFDWQSGGYTVNGGSFTVGELADNGIFGNINLISGLIDYTQDGGQSLDVSHDLNIQGGTFNIHGGSYDFTFPHESVFNLSGSGVLDIKDRGITLPAWSGAVLNITGGTIRATGGILNYSSHFNLSGGTIELYGSTESTLYCRAGNNFHNLLINKSGTGQVLATSYLELDGNFGIQSGTFDLNGQTLACAGNITVYGTFSLPPGAIVQISGDKQLSIANGGSFQAQGTDLSNALVTRNGNTGHYGFQVENAGSIGAVHTTFEYIGVDGLKIMNGALVDTLNSFNWCTFRQSPASGTLLAINNDQTLTIDRASFPANTWSGTYNVSKTANQGNVAFTNSRGDFCGASFEQDAYNRITWLPDVLEVTDLHLERIGYSHIHLWWTYTDPFTNFKIYASDTPEGPFTHVGTTVGTDTYWIGSTTNPRAFYRVTVVYEP